MQQEELIKDLEKVYNSCRTQEKIETQMQLKEIIERIKNDRSR